MKDASTKMGGSLMKSQNAWYWRPDSRYSNDCHWEFLCYGKPDIFWLQREYIEIKIA